MQPLPLYRLQVLGRHLRSRRPRPHLRRQQRRPLLPRRHRLPPRRLLSLRHHQQRPFHPQDQRPALTAGQMASCNQRDGKFVGHGIFPIGPLSSERIAGPVGSRAKMIHVPLRVRAVERKRSRNLRRSRPSRRLSGRRCCSQPIRQLGRVRSRARKDGSQTLARPTADGAVLVSLACGW